MADDRGPYVCTLRPELIIKAQTELFEDPRTRHQAIESFRKRILANKALTCRTDDRFLLRFLRARKFNEDRAYNLLINYFKVRAENRSIFKNLYPETVKHVLESGLLAVLPQRDKEGRKIIYTSAGHWDPGKYSIWDVLRTEVMMLESIIEDEETQINGVVFVSNMEGLGLKHLQMMDREYARISTSIYQDGFPIRLKFFHMIKESTLIDAMMALIKPFMKQKLLSRMKHHGKDFKELHEKHIAPEALPEEAGGTTGPYDNRDWVNSMLNLKPMFEEMENYQLILTDSSISQQKDSGSVAEDSAITGTFKKLNVD